MKRFYVDAYLTEVRLLETFLIVKASVAGEQLSTGDRKYAQHHFLESERFYKELNLTVSTITAQKILSVISKVIALTKTLSD